jgi:hypothetical protein
MKARVRKTDETEMGWVRKEYKKYTRRYKHGN